MTKRISLFFGAVGCSVCSLACGAWAVLLAGDTIIPGAPYFMFFCYIAGFGFLLLSMFNCFRILVLPRVFTNRERSYERANWKNYDTGLETLVND